MNDQSQPVPGQSTAAPAISCVVYRCSRKPGAYLFVERKNDFSRVPGSLLKLLGRLEPVMVLDLPPGRMLAQADPQTVVNQLSGQGYFLQMPPTGY